MRLKLFASAMLLIWTCDSYADRIDELVKSEMQRRHIPGLSLAVIDGGKIVKTESYGVVDLASGLPVTTTTLFQAGSVSKSVSALAALHLVEQGKLSLDEDVNLKLQSWKLPDNAFTKTSKVTLRGILSHSAGLSVHGFPGYAVGTSRPTLLQVLDGAKPANTDAIRVEGEPGAKWNYSGGGYTVMQQMMIDVTGMPFPELLQSTVLTPLGMKESTFEQPLPAALQSLTASGFLNDRKKVPGNWHIYPEMAAAGLWTTPSDLAHFVIGLQQSYVGSANPIISKSMTAQMMTVQKGHYGLGLFLFNKDNEQQFTHGGRDEGFDTLLVGTVHSGQGLIVMINTNDNSQMMQRIQSAVATAYHWPGADRELDVGKLGLKTLNGKVLEQLAGHYDLHGRIFTLTADHGHLVNLADGFPDSEFAAINASHFVSTDGLLKLEFARDGKGNVNGLVLTDHDHVMTMARIGGPVHTIRAQTGGRPYSEKVEALIKAGTDGATIQSCPYLTVGLKKIMGSNADPEFAQIKAIQFLTRQAISGAGFTRFDADIASVLYFNLVKSEGRKHMLVYLTADGSIADYDLVVD